MMTGEPMWPVFRDQRHDSQYDRVVLRLHPALLGLRVPRTIPCSARNTLDAVRPPDTLWILEHHGRLRRYEVPQARLVRSRPGGTVHGVAHAADIASLILPGDGVVAVFDAVCWNALARGPAHGNGRFREAGMKLQTGFLPLGIGGKGAA